jgi:ribonuclease III
MKDKLSELEVLIKIKFNDINLLKQSLIHKSFNSNLNNEKLEFLGDRVIGLILSKKLLKNYPDSKEGEIDKKFANLVNKKICAKIAKDLNIKKFMYLGSSNKNTVRSDEKIISDCLEALIGAIFLDQGIDISEKFILRVWNDLIKKSDLTIIDSKTQLQEYSLKKYKTLPKYKTEKQYGPQHQPIFKVEVQIPNSKKFLANGTSKKNAEQNAAKKLLKSLKI